MRTQDLPIVECPSDPRGRGRAHGESLRTVIALKVVRWRKAIAEAYGEPADEFLERFLRGTKFPAAIATHTPDLLEEIAGIAEAAAQPERLMLALQLMDEEWWFGRAPAAGSRAAGGGKAAAETAAERPAHCSSLSVAPAPGRPTLVGQTMDLPRWHDGAQAVLRMQESDGSETMVFTTAGMVGLMGASGRGLGICVNTLAALRSSPRGLPVACVLRGALARPDVESAAAFLSSVPHASGQAYQLGDSERARCFECSTRGAVEVPLTEGRCLHTNHVLASRDRRRKGAPEESEDSRRRLDSLTQDLSVEATPQLGFEQVKTALSATRPGAAVSVEPPAGKDPLAPMTVGAVVYELDGEVTFSVAAGPPSRETWMRFRLRGPQAG